MSFASKILAAGVAATLGLGAAAQAATISSYSAHTPFEYLTITDPNTLGVGTEGVDFNVKYDGWSELTKDNYENPPTIEYPSFPGNSSWPAPLAAQEGTRTLGQAASIDSIAGNSYPGGEAIYFGGFSIASNVYGGTLAVEEASALASLTSVRFDLAIAGAFGYSLYDPNLDPLVTGDELPVLVLTLNDTSTLTLAADSSSVGLIDTGETNPNDPTGSNILIDVYSLNWDVSAYDVSSFSVQFSGVQHAQVHEMALYQSDYVAPTVVDPTTSAVPEPASASLIALGGAALLMRRRRRSM